MKFTLSEWLSIRCALGTALYEAEECVASLEEELQSDPTPILIKDYIECKSNVTELANFIARIENAML